MASAPLALWILGLACTAWFAAEVAGLVARARGRGGPAAYDARTGRPLRVRRDRRAPDRRGRRASDEGPRRRS